MPVSKDTAYNNGCLQSMCFTISSQFRLKSGCPEVQFLPTKSKGASLPWHAGEAVVRRPNFRGASGGLPGERPEN